MKGRISVKLIFYRAIEEKLLRKHAVSATDVKEAFMNRVGPFARELRAANQGESPRFWFISKTNLGRKLKIVFADDRNEPAPIIITAYEPNQEEEKLYEKIR
jgi:uncharacterized DUF497 family protein